MESKPLIAGIIGFFLGGLLVSVAATTFERDKLQDAPGGHSLVSLEKKQGEAFDRAFIEEMITHHRGAIEMSELSRTQAEHQEIKDLSSNIIKAQAAEIEQLKQWQREWGYPTDPSPHRTHPEN